ncbi:MAG: hypothetical protein K2N48_04925 [Muribaculaceae bacterium]|nr:hypothetical protein [Muribaculaceae bacterium]
MKVIFEIPEKVIRQNAYLLMAQGGDEVPQDFAEKACAVESVELTLSKEDGKKFEQAIALLALAHIGEQMGI